MKQSGSYAIEPSTDTGRDILRRVQREGYSFLRAAEVRTVAKDPDTRLFALLVRFQGCRLTAPAQDVEHIIELMEMGGDSCRDVSIPAGATIAPAEAHEWTADEIREREA